MLAVEQIKVKVNKQKLPVITKLNDRGAVFSKIGNQTLNKRVKPNKWSNILFETRTVL